MVEKRRLERYDLKMAAKIEPVGIEAVFETFDLATCDVCAGGAFFQTYHPLPEGTPVNVEMLLPLQRLRVLRESAKQVFLLIHGTVLRCQEDGMAVRFGKDYEFRHLPVSGTEMA
ncbi:MAG: hypothetical protein JEZ11_02995 [Desulfobacterales bacterium]|nr:hypothetical protein [Desulfobacterales bacterium]